MTLETLAELKLTLTTRARELEKELAELPALREKLLQELFITKGRHDQIDDLETSLKGLTSDLPPVESK